MTRRVTLVVGPPAAGKSTWIRQQAAPGDTVVDFDDIARDLGSRQTHRHPPEVTARAVQAQKKAEREVAQMTDGTAFVARVASDPAERALLAARLRADVHVVDPGRSVVESRLGADRPTSARHETARWYRLNG
ncbi:MAG: AAA family ATPase [Actinomycetaceae bacterium]